jgi:hypothetical protein
MVQSYQNSLLILMTPPLDASVSTPFHPLKQLHPSCDVYLEQNSLTALSSHNSLSIYRVDHRWGKGVSRYLPAIALDLRWRIRWHLLS